MAVTVSDFQTAFPEFTVYNFATPAIQFWLDFAGIYVNQAVWGGPALPGKPFTPCDYGVLFYSAHNIALALQSVAAAPINPATGQPIGAPGMTAGIESQKAIDKVSVSLYIGAIIEEGAGNWNATSYGTRFARMARQFGSAPQYIGAGVPQTGMYAYAGPGYPFPGWFAW